MDHHKYIVFIPCFSSSITDVNEDDYLREHFPGASDIMLKMLKQQSEICKHDKDSRTRRWDKDIIQIALTLWNRYYLFIYLFIYLSIYLSISIATYLPIYVSIYQPIYLMTHPPTYLPTICIIPSYMSIWCRYVLVAERLGAILLKIV